MTFQLPTFSERQLLLKTHRQQQRAWRRYSWILLVAIMVASILSGINYLAWRWQSPETISAALESHPALVQNLCQQGAWYCFGRADVASNNLYISFVRSLAGDQLPPMGQQLKHSAADILPILKKHSVNAVTLPHVDASLPDAELRYASGRVNRSLSTSAERAGLSATQVSQLTHIFSDKVDFRTLQVGDQFHVLYQHKPATAVAKNANTKATPAILAAEIVTKGKKYRAVRYTDKQGRTNYYTPEGLSLKSGFVRSPVANARVSSGYSKNRPDPILGIYRAHEAVDFTASTGTPVKATGDGRIVVRGYKGGYGNVVEIQHGQGVQTLYAHLSRFAEGAKKGSRVTQGQVIGYVGSTGHSTGPHVHYEFKINGVKRNPLTIKLPGGQPIPTSEKNRFQQQITSILAQLEASKRVMLASAAPDFAQNG